MPKALKIFPGSFIINSLFCLLPFSAISADLPPGFAELLIAQNLDPTAMALAPDGRLFITEKNGRILIVENGVLRADPFLIINVDNNNERGLSGIAFDPDFEHNGYIYVYYTVKNANHNRVSRYTADGNYSIAGSEAIILELDPLFGSIHNGGSMAFGPDEKLYISVGDGYNDQAAQRLNSLLGKILRINADGTIPTDNPFFNQTSGKYGAIYATGFRNSFSLSIQPGTGRIFASEVGKSNWEEINEIIAGKNYGWPIIEGPVDGQIPPANYKAPVYYYDHGDGCAAVGAAFYNPDNFLFPSTYAGKFFFADYCHGYIKYMDPDVPDVVYPFAEKINRPLNLIVAPDGTMYYLARAGLGGGSEEDNTSTNNGTLWRIFYTGSAKPFISVNPQSLLVSQGEDAHFNIGVSGVEPLLYQWQQNGIDIPGANTAEYIFQNAMLSDSGFLFRVIVSNANGADTSLAATLSVTLDKRPVPEILSPLPGTTYRAGDVIHFSGHAIDPETGELMPTSLRWKIDFHHNVHTHPAMISTTGITGGDFTIPNTGETAEDVWYRIHLTATDARGLSKTVTRDVIPLKTIFHVNTIPGYLPVSIDGGFVTAPVTTISVVGMMRRIEASASVVVGDSIYLFEKWTDGVTTASRTFFAPDDTLIFTAIYQSFKLGKGTGVHAFYYDGPAYNPTFYEPYKITRIDTTIDFKWEYESPSEVHLGNDFWLARWVGFVEPLLTGDYNFHVIADDGLRLWVDEELLINAWIPQPATEWTGTIALEAGKQYPIKLEFFEEAYGAICQLYWSSSRIAKGIIPKSQLFPERTTSVDSQMNHKIPLTLFPNPVRTLLFVELKDQSKELKEIEIYNSLGQLILQRTEGFQSPVIEVNMHSLPAGAYWLKYKMEDGVSGAVQFMKE